MTTTIRLDAYFHVELYQNPPASLSKQQKKPDQNTNAPTGLFLFNYVDLVGN
ncbi:hypothetical protein [Paenibacillus foliorum]|uniref:hypothetical protein n=1 Tax=Paenibacillus foliorum TaxID=2654974 RepID=UPI001490FF86|nr:hypothetical protein [Paenibacillus foliorum]